MRHSTLYFLIVVFLTSCAISPIPANAQNKLIVKTRNDGSVVSDDYRLFSHWNFKMPRGLDTSNRMGLFGIDSLGQLYFDSTHQRVWVRSTATGFVHKWSGLATTTDVTNNSFWTLSGSNLYPNLTTYNVGI